MGRPYKYVPINRIFSKLVREGIDVTDEGDIIEQTGEALEFIGAIPYYEEAVHFADVKNHQMQLPKWTHSIIQVGRNMRTDSLEQAGIRDKDIAKSIGDEVFQLFTTSKNGLTLNDEEIPYYKSFFGLRCSFNSWSSCGLYNSCYAPVRLSTSTLFNSLVCGTNDNCNNSNSCNDEYSVVRGSILRFSFKEGTVAVPYTRQVVDEETDYPLVPDDISYTTAIVAYIRLKKLAKTEFGSNTWKTADSDWQWYCGQAGSKAMMPFGIDEHQNLLDQRSYILPRNDRYFGFFGNLNKPEVRGWNDPSGRNYNGGRGFIGN